MPAGKVMQTMRVALTGQRVSPGIFETMVAMGADVVRQRLAAARAWLAGRAASQAGG